MQQQRRDRDERLECETWVSFPCYLTEWNFVLPTQCSAAQKDQSSSASRRRLLLLRLLLLSRSTSHGRLIAARPTPPLSAHAFRARNAAGHEADAQVENLLLVYGEELGRLFIIAFGIRHHSPANQGVWPLAPGFEPASTASAIPKSTKRRGISLWLDVHFFVLRICSGNMEDKLRLLKGASRSVLFS